MKKENKQAHSKGANITNIHTSIQSIEVYFMGWATQVVGTSKE
jgi:hypothetical protein